MKPYELPLYTTGIKISKPAGCCVSFELTNYWWRCSSNNSAGEYVCQACGFVIQNPAFDNDQDWRLEFIKHVAKVHPQHPAIPT